MVAPITDVRWLPLRISPKTVWSFVELVDADGRVGTGEATLGRREGPLARALADGRAALLGKAPRDVDLAPLRAAAAALPQFAVVSALDQAVWDLDTRQRGLRVCEALGTPRREPVGLYANINRGIAERTPEGFAVQARAAVADGYAAVKIAPFDEVELRGDDGAAIDRVAIDRGLARIAAVRAAIGGAVDLMVDCHWRFNEAAAALVLRETQPLALHWLECPLPENEATLPALRRLRTQANTMGVRLAGCEEASLVAGFEPYLRAGAYDVMMPDAKYVGGLREMLAVAERLRAAGVGFSPHNPSGPVCHAASLHVCAVVDGDERLELQYDETPLFRSLVNDALPVPAGGRSGVPAGPGLGVALDAAAVASLAVPSAA